MFADPGDRGLGRSRGGFTIKLHLALDQGQTPVSIVVTAGQRGRLAAIRRTGEGPRAPHRTGPTRIRPDRVRADKAYPSRKKRADLRRRGICCIIPDKADQARNRRKWGSRGGRRTSTRPTLWAPYRASPQPPRSE
ncbi:transposase [Streptomyces anulatus]|uniref:transposase n=1 Tax=Streptomyces anulatus TaxID=1892 RepID=UPI003B8263A8